MPLYESIWVRSSSATPRKLTPNTAARPDLRYGCVASAIPKIIAEIAMATTSRIV